jgi:hypothetical protein
MNIANEMVKEVLMEAPDGHKHIRTKIILQDNKEIVFQEATIANIVRAYITLKTHPKNISIRLKGQHLESKKQGFADWQLMEE